VFTVLTDTVAGLGAWLDDEVGIRELMEKKSRGLNDTKILALVLSYDDLVSGKYVVLDDFARELVEKHKGAPLTLVLPKSPDFKHWYYDHFVDIGVRFPSNELMREMAEKAPFLLTSDNKRGEAPLQIGGQATTVARVRGGVVEVLRQGEVRL
jgi:tRNA A37 threonylcarbamoyladenosine synthetase subunit TsaC/SUA5/YrdC